MAESILFDIATEVLEKIGSLAASQKVDGKFRHFSHGDTELCGEEFLQLIVDNSRSVRSIVFAAAEKYRDAPIIGSFISEDVSKLKYLRLLNLCHIRFEVLPDFIGTLRHLRYLDLAWNYSLKKIPESFCELQNLHMLNLRGCRKLKKLPNNIRKMISLRYLETPTQEEILPENGIGSSERCISGSVISLPNTIKYLTKLEMLVIWDCPDINLKMELQGQDCDLRLSLKKFIIHGLESLVDLPEVLLQASPNTLKFMAIRACERLEALRSGSKISHHLKNLRLQHAPNCHLFRRDRTPYFTQGIEDYKASAPVRPAGHDGSKIAHIPMVHLI
ncbi:hypothetical protein Pint_16991 [Pistacia integerrima]|uniref:Uncharacterized protein n=1 Tax=Pistacia integerrima TaxID=434235 RepID=A0ACC0ZF98_9ROSI|nr:hypothetical protein Pint_16991 [Pistacia integerrima]